MAGEDDPLSALRRTLASLDDAALASLASLGLLRRARKDLEQGETVTVAASVALPLEVSVAGCVVRIPAAGPAAATCTCPAPGTCRHILMAVLHLQQGAGEPAKEEEAVAGPLYTLEEITRWAGKKTFQEALRLLATASEVGIEETGPGAATVRFPEFGVEVRHLPGTGLDGMIANAPAKVRRRFQAAAVLAWQRSKGLAFEELAEEKDTVLREPAGAPRTRSQVLAEARSLFGEMLTVGLSHLSAVPKQRLATLAVSALGANLPRLSLALRGLADEVDLLLRRDARADEARLFLSLAGTDALCEALGRGNPPVELVGEHRSHYETAGTLELYGMGAYAWRTRSGFGGLTVLFWSPAARRWLTWSESRPRHTDARFSPAERYGTEGPWRGIANPKEASRSRFNLLSARRNGEGRLSASAASQAVPLGPSRPRETDFGDRLFTSFGELRRHAAAVYPVGLAERRAGDEIVVVRPAAWGPRGFDPILQTFRWELRDEQGEPLLLEIPWDDVGKPAIETLESIHPERDGVWGLAGRIGYADASLSLAPAVLFRQGEPEIVSLGLDAFQGSAGRPGPGSRLEIPAPPVPPWLTSIERDLSRIEEGLQHLAEAGRRTFGALPAGLAGAARDLEARGLPLLAAAVGGLAGEADDLPRRLCRARHLCQLHRQAAIRTAIAG